MCPTGELTQRQHHSVLPADLDAKALSQELPLVLQQLLNKGSHLLWGAVTILQARE